MSSFENLRIVDNFYMRKQKTRESEQYDAE